MGVWVEQMQTSLYRMGASPPAQQVKNPPTIQETRVQCLGQKDPLEEGMATHPSILAWRISWTEELDTTEVTEHSTYVGWIHNTVLLYST